MAEPQVYAEFMIVSTEPAWSTNQDRKMNIHERNRYVRAWHIAARQGWQLFGPKDLRAQIKDGYSLAPGIVQVNIPFAQRRRRDPHNYCGTVLKAVIDGLVKEGLWPDDTPEWVGHREPIPLIGTQGLVTIYEWWD